VPGGDLDDSAYLTVLDEDGIPRPITLLIEVKNIRHWIYPSSSELYQLLDKAARLQLAHPDLFLLPVLICRRANYVTFVMAKSLGFWVMYMTYQPILPHSSVSARALGEVCRGLGYNIVATSDPHDFLVDSYRNVLPKAARGVAETWSRSAAVVGRFAPDLRKDGLSDWTRKNLVDRLAEAIQEELAIPVHWRTVTTEEEEQE
jgi:hypothetical protein